MPEHLHDPDLILALADGSLPAAPATPAAAEVAGCAQCATDLAMQRTALTALAGLPRAQMTHAERTRIRRDLRAALHLEEVAESEPVAAASSRSRRRPVWGLAAAAAVFLAIVAVPPAFRALSPGGDDATFEAAVATTAPDADESVASAPSADVGAAQEGADLVGGSVADGLTPETESTLRAEDGVLGLDDGGAGSDTLPVIVLEEPGNLVTELSAVKEFGVLPSAPGAPSLAVDPDTVAACREAVPSGGQGYPVAITDVGGVTAVVMVYPGGPGIRIAAQSLDGCTVLILAGP